MERISSFLTLLMVFGCGIQAEAQIYKGQSDSLKMTFGFPTIILADEISFKDENENNLMEPDEISLAVFTIKNTSKYPARNVTIRPEELNKVKGFDEFSPVIVGDIPGGGEKLVEVGINSTPELEAGTANFVFHLYEKGVESDISIVFSIATTDQPMTFGEEEEEDP